MGEAPASERQKEFLGNLGVEKIPEGLTRADASLWIEELVKIRDEGGPATRSDAYVTPPRRVPKSEAPTPDFKPAIQVGQPAKPVPETKEVPAPGPSAPTSPSLTGLSEEQVRLLKSLGRFPSDATPDEVSFGLNVARRFGLDPFRKQIRFVRFRQTDPIDPFVTIDGLYAIAARTGEWAGIDPPQYEVNPEHPEVPVSASATVYRMVHGTRYPFAAIVRFSEFVKRNREGEMTRPWQEMPFHMLGKVARAHALRMAFPEELSGVYEESEAPVDVT
jgi:phage recombination protein Bet